MKRCLALAAVFLFLPISVAGQAPSSRAANESRVSDATGDVQLYDRLNQRNITAAPPGSYDHIDILGAWIGNETATEVEFGLALRQWDETKPEPRIAYLIANFEDITYQVLYFFRSPNNWACRPDQGVWYPPSGKVQCLNATAEPNRATVHIFVPKELLLDRNVAPLRPGTQLTNFHARTEAFLGGPLAMQDRAPDAGVGPPFHSEVGAIDQSGRIFLSSKLPIRASNGESTTMVFNATVTNRADAADVVTLGVTGLDPDWHAKVPSRVRVAAGASADVPVLVTMPFTHDHGVTRMFKLEARSTARISDYAMLDLGVHWLEVPQPAGHHDKLWIHSAPGGTLAGSPAEETKSRGGWLNALEKDLNPAADDGPVAGHTLFPVTTYYVVTSTTVSWGFRLRPDLRIGLDVDAEKPGMFETSLHSTFPATAATLSADLNYVDPQGTTPGRSSGKATVVTLASGKSRTFSLPANAPLNVNLDLIPNASVPSLHYKAGSSLSLALRLDADIPQGLTLLTHRPNVILFPKASLLTLPLKEYHDPVDQAFENIGTLSLHALDPFEKQLNPSRTAAFRFDLTNHAKGEQRLRLSIEGINKEWATIAGAPEFDLESNGKRQVTLLVQAPEDAQAGERAELFLVAENVEEPAAVALARIRAMVVSVEVADVSNEASILRTEDGGGTPSWTIGLTMIALVVALAFRRN